MTRTIAVSTVETPDDGERNCPKHVEIYSKNKLEELVHLVGFIIRIYHNARSPEPQINIWSLPRAGRESSSCNSAFLSARSAASSSLRY